MSATWEQLSRVRQMALGDPTWDLSDNDRAALRALLDEHAAPREIAEAAKDFPRHHPEDCACMSCKDFDRALAKWPDP